MKEATARRSFLAGGAALTAPAGAEGLAAASPSPDAELIRLCADYLLEESRINGQFVATEDRQADNAAKLARYRRAVDAGAENDLILMQIAELPAHTPEGINAKAQIIRGWLGGDPDNPTLARYASPQERLAWSLTIDLLGRA